MTASSQFGTGYQPAYGRLNGNRGDGWCAKEANRNDDWLQIDLGKMIEVCALATQGDRNGNEWTTAFKLSYSTDGNSWTPYKDANSAEVVRYISVFANHRINKIMNTTSVHILSMSHNLNILLKLVNNPSSLNKLNHDGDGIKTYILGLFLLFLLSLRFN